MDHEHGSMDTTQQERTFHGFLRMAIWAVAIVAAILIFLGLANA